MSNYSSLENQYQDGIDIFWDDFNPNGRDYSNDIDWGAYDDDSPPQCPTCRYSMVWNDDYSEWYCDYTPEC